MYKHGVHTGHTPSDFYLATMQLLDALTQQCRPCKRDLQLLYELLYSYYYERQ